MKHLIHTNEKELLSIKDTINGNASFTSQSTTTYYLNGNSNYPINIWLWKYGNIIDMELKLTIPANTSFGKGRLTFTKATASDKAIPVPFVPDGVDEVCFTGTYGCMDCASSSGDGNTNISPEIAIIYNKKENKYYFQFLENWTAMTNITYHFIHFSYTGQ